MQECPKCHNSFYFDPDFCPNCNARMPAKDHAEINVDTTKGTGSTPYPVRNRIPPDEYTCDQAKSLDKWGMYFFLISLIIAIITAIAGGYQLTTNNYGLVVKEFNLGAVFSLGSVISFLSWVGGGYALSLILDSFAVIVEASFRSMTKY